MIKFDYEELCDMLLFLWLQRFLKDLFNFDSIHFNQ